MSLTFNRFGLDSFYTIIYYFLINLRIRKIRKFLFNHSKLQTFLDQKHHSCSVPSIVNRQMQTYIRFLCVVVVLFVQYLYSSSSSSHKMIFLQTRIKFVATFSFGSNTFWLEIQSNQFKTKNFSKQNSTNLTYVKKFYFLIGWKIFLYIYFFALVSSLEFFFTNARRTTIFIHRRETYGVVAAKTFSLNRSLSLIGQSF